LSVIKSTLLARRLIPRSKCGRFIALCNKILFCTTLLFSFPTAAPNNNNNNNNNNNGKGTCMLIDVAISGDRNVIKKEADNIVIYKELTTEIQRMWNVKTKVIPVIIGATGTVSKSLRKYVSNIPGKHEVKELQKTAILGTAHTYLGKY